MESGGSLNIFLFSEPLSYLCIGKFKSYKDMNELIQQFHPITLDEMKSIRLMNRMDTKFVTTRQKLISLLEMALQDYRIQEINGERNMEYDTTYFDTRQFDMYYDHQYGHSNRQKIRFRTYVSSDLQFMEVKTKNNHGRTKKKRMEVTDMDLADFTKRQFLAEHLCFDVDSLIPTLNNHFKRITLVNSAKTERLTIDSDLCFNNLITGEHKDMGKLVIIELKRDGLCYSPVLGMLQELHIHPHGFSKYCMGSALTNSKLKINRFKPNIIDIKKIMAQAV